jgi:molecular chaperone GrpE
VNEDTEQTQSPKPAQQATEQPTAEPSESERLTAELAECKDRMMRTAAELDNMRRRFDREKADLLKFGQEKLFLDFLPALDSLDRALPEGETNGGDGYLEGMRMVKRQILDVFKKHGLEPIDVKGAAFDPNLHQAIQRIDSSDVSVDTVKDEYAKGYLLHGRLLRPAMVSVLTPTAGH